MSDVFRIALQNVNALRGSGYSTYLVVSVARATCTELATCTEHGMTILVTLPSGWLALEPTISYRTSLLVAS
jgi:hypothetical protein